MPWICFYRLDNVKNSVDNSTEFFLFKVIQLPKKVPKFDL